MIETVSATTSGTRVAHVQKLYSNILSNLTDIQLLAHLSKVKIRGYIYISRNTLNEPYSSSILGMAVRHDIFTNGSER